MNILEHKYQYYREWYCDLAAVERVGWLGKWVFERVAMFSELLRQQETQSKVFHRNVQKV